MPRESPTTGGSRVFQRHVRRLLLSRVQWASGLATILMPLGLIVDALDRSSMGPRIMPLRLAISAGFLTIYAASRIPQLARASIPLSFAMTFLGGLGATLMGMFTVSGAGRYYGSAHLVILSCGLLFPWNARTMAMACVGVMTIFITPHLVIGRLDTGAFTETYLLLCSGAIATIGSYLSYGLREREFRSRRDLKARTRELGVTTRKMREMAAARTRFYENVSHELRTPLTLILAPLEMLRGLSAQQVPPAIANYLQTIHRNALLLLRLVNGILDLHQLEAGRMSLHRVPLDLSSALAKLIPEFHALAEARGQRIELHKESAPPTLADADMMETVLRNLLSNAVKYTPDGGLISVRVSGNGHSVIVEVSDTGRGIAAENLERIFERFERVDEDTGVPGSGIGLALVKELVHHHGGQVFVKSTVGKGSTFRVELPAFLADHAEAQIAHAPASVEPSTWWTTPPPTRVDPPTEVGGLRERLLVVEDNEELRAFLRQFLRVHFHVYEARDVATALEMARTHLPAVIVSDVMLPGETGLSLLKSLREHSPTAGIPVIFLTALHGLESRVEGLEHGAADYVSKPFGPSELLARIRVQLRLRQLTAHLAQAQKLSMLHTLSAGLAHEIRNPINAITNGIALLRRAVSKWDDAKAGAPGVVPDLLNVIEESCDRMAALIDDLLSFSEGKGGASSAFWNPTLAVESALRLLHPRLAEVRVHQDLTFDGELSGNCARLNQVVLNLLDNALRAVTPRGDVWIRTEELDGGFCMTVRDSGHGIPADELARVFDPFFTTRAVNEGMGLGLHICRTIIEAHGGQIRVSSEKGLGAAFVFSLPLNVRDTRAARVAV